MTTQPIAPPPILWDVDGKRYIYAGLAENGLPTYAPAQAALIPANAPPRPVLEAGHWPTVANSVCERGGRVSNTCVGCAGPVFAEVVRGGVAMPLCDACFSAAPLPAKFAAL